MNLCHLYIDNRITNDNVEQQDINIDQDDDTPSILQR